MLQNPPLTIHRTLCGIVTRPKMNSNFEIDPTSNRLRLPVKQTLMHYYIILLPITLFAIIQLTDLETFNLNLLIGCLLTSLFFGFIQWRFLKFKEFKVDCQETDLLSAFNRAARSLDWKIESSNNILCAFDKEKWEVRYNTGYIILISKTQNGFLFNSLSDPRRFAAPLVRPLYNLNKNVFIKHLRDVIADREYNEEFDFLNKKWGLRNTLTRLFLYPLSIGLILLTVYSFTQNLTTGIIYLILSSIISVIYLTYDIKSLMK